VYLARVPIEHACAIAIIGLIAGTLGGLAGVGGSVFMLPALHIVFSPLVFGEPADAEVHHLYMAAAMCVNIIVSLVAAWLHHGEGAVRVPFLRTLVPVSCVAMGGGVLLSNLFSGEALSLLLAVFLVLYCVWNLRIIFRPNRRKFGGQGRVEKATPERLLVCGGATGVVGGLLGLGGGFLMVPLLQIMCNVRLKNAIATSSAVLCITAAVGAAMKLATLGQHHERITDALLYAALAAPTAVLGALLGAKWLHRLPVTAVRLVMTILILAVATRLV
jgi:uncharacterized membrane protein YfcA